VVHNATYISTTWDLSSKVGHLRLLVTADKFTNFSSNRRPGCSSVVCRFQGVTLWIPTLPSSRLGLYPTLYIGFHPPGKQQNSRGLRIWAHNLLEYKRGILCDSQYGRQFIRLSWFQWFSRVSGWAMRASPSLNMYNRTCYTVRCTVFWCIRLLYSITPPR